MINPDTLTTLLAQQAGNFSFLLPFKKSRVRFLKLDLSPANKAIQNLDMTDNTVFSQYLAALLKETGSDIAVGGYMERRSLYSRSDHFGSGQSARDIHLGIDLWTGAGTTLLAPLDGTIHSFAINKNYRDYGPAIILEHKMGGVTFYTLYGHLSVESLSGKSPGDSIKRGDLFASVGVTDENGSWPPHVHFQVISDMGSYSGDFPGVSSEAERSKYSALCPDPNLLLGIDEIIINS